MMAPKVNSDEEEPDIIRSTITKDTALQEVGQPTASTVSPVPVFL